MKFKGVLCSKRFKLLPLFILIIFSLIIIPNTVVAQYNSNVLFDESGPYYKYFTIYNLGPYGASGYANLLEKNGFSVNRLTEAPITTEKLKGYDVLILMAPARNYSDEEINAIHKFVNEGGGLFILADGWGTQDGDENYSFNKIARSFGLDFSYNSVVTDPKNYLGIPNYIKVSDIKESPLTKGVNDFYFLQGPYLKSVGSSDVMAYSSSDSWADKGSLTAEGNTVNNGQKESDEATGPLPIYSSMSYGKGKIVFFGSVVTFTNSWIYRSNGWILGLNAVNWLSNHSVSSNYITTGFFSPNLAGLEYNILGMVLFTIILISGLGFKIRRDKKLEDLRPVKTIKNWKYNGLIAINSIFAILGAFLFIPINFYLFDISIPDIYDPYFGYALLATGIIFLFLVCLIIYNIYARQRMVINYSSINISLLLLFAGLTVILGDIFSFPMMFLFTAGSLFLLIPFIVNLWMIRNYGNDLIIEGKEFNRLAKLSSRSLPYELHSIYTDSAYVGEGGFGRVFKGKRKDGLEVALKIPKTFDKKSETIFVSEISNWMHLDHPNIVKLYNFKILPIPYIEMEYCKESLPHGKKPLNEAIKVIYEAAQGLRYAHSRNIIHGDIKTSNIMLNNGIYKISDWGLSKIKTQESVTLSGATPQYAAPEQISHEFGRADERTDVYQLGTVFYEMVTGNLPFKGEISQIYGSILNTPPEVPTKFNPDAETVEEVIMKCLSKNKDDRYSSMDELIEVLEIYYEPSISTDKTVIWDDMDDKT